MVQTIKDVWKEYVDVFTSPKFWIGFLFGIMIFFILLGILGG